MKTFFPDGSIKIRTFLCLLFLTQIFLIKCMNIIDNSTSHMNTDNHQFHHACKSRPIRFTSRHNLSLVRIINQPNDNHNRFGTKSNVFWIVTEHEFHYCLEDCATLKIKNEKNSVDKHREYAKFTKLNHNSNLEFKMNRAKTMHPQKWPKPASGTMSQRSTTTTITTSTTTMTMTLRNSTSRVECRPFVKKTDYDFLLGISNRSKLKGLPEPELIQLFANKNDELTISELRNELLSNQNKQGVRILNRMGNFNRLIGDSHNAIECFRRALHLEPRNSYLLINLARLLFKLKHYDDAIFLTKRSIEFTQQGRSTWFQHFTLGEIYHAIGHDSQSLAHVRLALKLNPKHAPAMKLATELASKSFIQSSRFSHMFRLFERVFFFLTSTAPSFYLQLFFHMFILVFLILFGLIYSLLSIICDVRLSTRATLSTYESYCQEYSSSSSSSIVNGSSSNRDQSSSSSVEMNKFRKRMLPLSMRMRKTMMSGFKFRF